MLLTLKVRNMEEREFKDFDLRYMNNGDIVQYEGEPFFIEEVRIGGLTLQGIDREVRTDGIKGVERREITTDLLDSISVRESCKDFYSWKKGFIVIKTKKTNQAHRVFSLEVNGAAIPGKLNYIDVMQSFTSSPFSGLPPSEMWSYVSRVWCMELIKNLNLSLEHKEKHPEVNYDINTGKIIDTNKEESYSQWKKEVESKIENIKL